MIGTSNRLQRAMLSPAQLKDGEIEAGGTLYFLEGQYLLRYPENGAVKSKFVTAADVAAAFTQTDVDSGWLPAGMVRVGQRPTGTFFVYSAPAQKVDVQLAADETPVTIPIPRTVLLGIGPAYYLWALKSKYFEGVQVAFKAPFSNVNPGGRICWGQFTPPEANGQNARIIWELFFKTPFNEDLAVGKSMAQHNDVRKQLGVLFKKRARVYPLDDLVPEDHDSRISQWIERILNA